MNTAPKNPPAVSFFVPIGIGVLAQMACAGLVTAVTAIGFSSSGPTSSDAQTPGLVESESSDSASSGTPSQAARSGTAPLLASAGETVTGTEPDTGAPMATDGNSADRDPAGTNPADSKAAEAAGTSAAASNGTAVAAASGDAPPEAEPAAQTKPLDDIRTRSRLLTIAGEGIPDEIVLCQILVTDVANVKMELIGAEFSKPRALTMELEKQPIDGQSCTWSVRQVSAVGFDRVQPVGEFELKDQQLSFRWQKNADKGKLPFCRLKISADADTEVCELWSPVRTAALKVKLEALEKGPAKSSPFLPPGIQLPPAESLQLDFTLEEWPEHTASRDSLTTNEPADIIFSDHDYDPDLLRIQLTLKPEDGQLAVQALYFTSVPKSSRKGKVEIDKELQLKPADLEKLVKDMATEKGRYQRELVDIDKDLQKLDAAQENLDKQVDAFGLRPELVQKQNANDRKADDLADRRTVAEELVKVYSGAHTAMGKLSELCEKIEENGRVHFQLVRPLEGGAADVVISSSVSAQATEEARNVP